ncbi:MAG: MaoC family dehydratase [Anaerolineae bacterium]|nr:MaoC family dehydratase [Anaerolineae bacterium]
MGFRLEVGEATTLRRRMTLEDFARFAALSGDDNPIHTDPDFAARTRFGRPVAHGMFLFGLISALIGDRIPGAVLLEQELMFPTPTYADEEVSVHMEVAAIRADEGIAELTTTIIRPSGEAGCQGRAVVHVGTVAGWPRLPDIAIPAVSTEAVAFKGLRWGQRATLRRTFTLEDVQAYIDLTGDANPLYTDRAYATGRGFRGAILPGPLLGALISCLLGTHLPGWGTNYLKQRFYFLAPAYPGEAIVAAVRVTRLRPEKELVNLRTTCRRPTRETLCDGEALVLVRDVREK